MTRRMLGRGLVVAVVVVAGGLSLVGLRAARLGAFRVACQSNLRRLGNGSIAYACDWDEWFPTCISRKGGVLNGVYRLPVIGFDTGTALGSRWASYPPGYSVGGWAYLLRDYVMNDFDAAVCPDGWYTKRDFLQPWDGRDPKDLYSDKMSYLWLVARDVPSAVANGQRSVDVKTEFADRGGGGPTVLLSADYVLWAGAGDGFGISGNHQQNKAGKGNVAGWPAFDPADPSAGWAKDRPTYRNVVRRDCRSESREFLDLPMYRYIVDASPRVHVW